MVTRVRFVTRHERFRDVARMAEYNEIPHAILDASREDKDAQVAAVLAAIDGVLAAPRGR